MSVDNYFPANPTGNVGKLKKIIKKIIGRTVTVQPVEKLSKYNHLVQSFYAMDFLLKYEITSYLLTDYLSDEHLSQIVDTSKKENIVAYNPKKGFEFTVKLIASFKDIKFVAIENMTSLQVSELLQISKIYIDFGNHPGKDRIPREAAMAKCVLITGKKGSANNNHDVVIDETYKVDENNAQSVNKTGVLINSILGDFDKHNLNFESYRRQILQEKDNFQKQVQLFVNRI
ncbi:hypothetical protein [Psychromonas ingrahamii]|uniref:hypothetical protein n=1 Tax=Psychromonas ingrahamii TaxID=357794 RepID=UPI00031DCA08|nr:hypothetical protein [Psychromonas ingrahamii]